MRQDGVSTRGHPRSVLGTILDVAIELSYASARVRDAKREQERLRARGEDVFLLDLLLRRPIAEEDVPALLARAWSIIVPGAGILTPPAPSPSPGRA